MAQPDIIRGTYFVLAMGDGGNPTETFLALCGITTRTFTAQINTNDVFTRDCADPEDIPIRRLITTGRQWSLSGEGQLNRDNLDTIIAAQGLTKNYRFYYTEPADDEVFRGYWEGPAKMVNLTVNASDDDFAGISLQFESDGLWEWTPTAGS
jgi:predicted secreted protein